MVITRKDFAKKIAEETGVSQSNVMEVLKGMPTVLYAELAQSNEVKAFDGVTFCTVERAARMCRNPRTGEAISKPAKKVPKVRFGKSAKEFGKQ